MRYEINQRDIKKITDKISGLIKLAQTETSELLRETSIEVLRNQRRDVPYVTGRLQRGLRVELEKYDVVFANDVPYARIIEEGGKTTKRRAQPYFRQNIINGWRKFRKQLIGKIRQKINR